MKTKSLFPLCFVILHSLGCLSAHAQGTAFTYQGRLNDGPNPASGSYDLLFSLYPADTGGGQVGPLLTNAPVAVSNGLFTVTLDFGANFPGADRWLEIAVRTNDGGAFSTLSPRQPVTPTPYAITATSAVSAGSVAAANITGTIPLAQLPAAVVTNGASGVNFSGTFSGNGAGVTNVSVPLSAVKSGGAISWPGNFTVASSPAVGNSPQSVTAADVNGDGQVDLISANNSADTLTVLTNNGSGGFMLAASPAVGDEPFSVTTADVNGDGQADLISANVNANTLTVLTNNGSGDFVLASSPGVGNFPRSVTAADVNGDGQVDLISANTDAFTLTVLTNNGSGGFVLASSPGVDGFPQSVTAADVNGDHQVDLISANAVANTLAVFTNNGSGGFELAATLSVGVDPNSVTAADVNGDGKVDLISANSGPNTLTVLTNNGSGDFVLASSPGVGDGPRSVTAADVNGDGQPDLISANESANTLTVLTNNGSGGFLLASSPGVGDGPRSVTAADVNGDGQPDLISANAFGPTLTVLFNMSTFAGQFTGQFTGQHTGDGSGMTSLNAVNLTGTVPAAALNNAWRISGNAGTTPGTQFLGTLDNQPLEFKVNGLRALRLEQPFSDLPNIIGGSSGNTVGSGILAATIAGGGGAGQPNLITNSANHAVIGGGKGNVVGGTGSGGSGSVIAGGDRNTASGQIAVVGGGQFNSAGGTYSVIPGGANNTTASNATFAFAAGQRAKANHMGSFVWADSQPADFASTVSNQFLIRAAGGVGIGTAAPGDMLHVVGQSVRARVESTNSTFAGYITKNSHAEWFMGLNPGSGNGTWDIFQNSSPAGSRLVITTNGNVGIGTSAVADKLHVQSATSMQIRAQALDTGSAGFLSKNSVSEWFAGIEGESGDWKLIENAPNFSVGLITVRAASGNVGINRFAIANKLEVEGNASKTTAGSWLANSDARIKRDIQPVIGALDKLSQVRLVSFRYTDEYRRSHASIEDRPYLNVVAQEFREVFPEHVKSSGEKLADGSEILQVDTYPLTIYAAAAVQELDRKMEARSSELEARSRKLEAENTKLQQQNAELETRLSALEKFMKSLTVAQGGE